MCKSLSAIPKWKWGQCLHYQIETPSLKTKVSEMTELLVKKFEGGGQSLSYAVPKEKV